MHCPINFWQGNSKVKTLRNPVDLLIWQPHYHLLISDAVFDNQGNFHPMPKIGQDRDEIIKILKYLALWPIEYPQPPPRASPMYMELLSKLAASRHFHPVE